MTLCANVKTGRGMQCHCQPQEGIMCEYGPQPPWKEDEMNEDREERIRKAERAYPLTQLDRREIVHEIRELKLLRDTHPELAIRCYTRTNALLEMLDSDENVGCAKHGLAHPCEECAVEMHVEDAKDA